jgi:hypothetical protein
MIDVSRAGQRTQRHERKRLKSGRDAEQWRESGGKVVVDEMMMREVEMVHDGSESDGRSMQGSGVRVSR